MRETQNLLSTKIYLLHNKGMVTWTQIIDHTLEWTHIQPQKIFLFIKGIQNHGVFLGHVGNNHPNYIHTFHWDKNVKYSPISRLKRIPVWVKRCQRRGFKWCLWENVFTQKLMKTKDLKYCLWANFMRCLDVEFLGIQWSIRYHLNHLYISIVD